MPDWPVALAKIAKAATKALRPAPQVRSEIGKRQDLTPLLLDGFVEGSVFGEVLLRG